MARLNKKMLWCLLPVVCTALCTVYAEALSEAERVEIQVEVLLHYLGTPPFGHPAGKAQLLCVTADHDIEPLVYRSLATATGLEVRGQEFCTQQQAETFGSWVVGKERGEPALSLGVSTPVLIAPNIVDIRVSLVAGGRWGSGALCRATKQDSRWQVQECKLGGFY